MGTSVARRAGDAVNSAGLSVYLSVCLSVRLSVCRSNGPNRMINAHLFAKTTLQQHGTAHRPRHCHGQPRTALTAELCTRSVC